MIALHINVYILCVHCSSTTRRSRFMPTCLRSFFSIFFSTHIERTWKWFNWMFFFYYYHSLRIFTTSTKFFNRKFRLSLLKWNFTIHSEMLQYLPTKRFQSHILCVLLEWIALFLRGIFLQWNVCSFHSLFGVSFKALNVNRVQFILHTHIKVEMVVIVINRLSAALNPQMWCDFFFSF